MLFLVFPAFSQDTDDVVNWNEFTFILPLVEKKEGNKKLDSLNLNLTFVWRQGRNLRRPIDKRLGLGLSYRLNKHFTFGSSYSYREARPTESPRFFEHRLNFFLQAEKKWENVSLRSRLLTMYQIFHSRKDLVVQRARLQPNFSVRFKKKEIFSVFIAGEVFYGYKDRKLYRNDFFIGITKSFTPRLAADFFFIRQNISSGSLKETYGFGTAVRYRISR